MAWAASIRNPDPARINPETLRTGLAIVSSATAIDQPAGLGEGERVREGGLSSSPDPSKAELETCQTWGFRDRSVVGMAEGCYACPVTAPYRTGTAWHE